MDKIVHKNAIFWICLAGILIQFAPFLFGIQYHNLEGTPIAQAVNNSENLRLIHVASLAACLPITIDMLMVVAIKETSDWDNRGFFLFTTAFPSLVYIFYHEYLTPLKYLGIYHFGFLAVEAFIHSVLISKNPTTQKSFYLLISYGFYVCCVTFKTIAIIFLHQLIDTSRLVGLFGLLCTLVVTTYYGSEFIYKSLIRWEMNNNEDLVFSLYLVMFLSLAILIQYERFSRGFDNFTNLPEDYFVHVQTYFLIFGALATTVPGRIATIQAEASKMMLNTKGTFVRYVSHEIRTPLNIVFAGLELVMKKLSKPNLQSCDQQQSIEIVSDVYEAAHSALDLVNDLLHYENMEANTFQLETTWRIPAGVLSGLKISVLSVFAHKYEVELIVQDDLNIFKSMPTPYLSPFMTQSLMTSEDDNNSQQPSSSSPPPSRIDPTTTTTTTTSQPQIIGHNNNSNSSMNSPKHVPLAPTTTTTTNTNTSTNLEAVSMEDVKEGIHIHRLSTDSRDLTASRSNDHYDHSNSKYHHKDNLRHHIHVPVHVPLMSARSDTGFPTHHILPSSSSQHSHMTSPYSFKRVISSKKQHQIDEDHLLLSYHRAVLKVDTIRLEQVIRNLLTNAIKFTPKKGKIFIHTYMKRIRKNSFADFYTPINRTPYSMSNKSAISATSTKTNTATTTNMSSKSSGGTAAAAAAAGASSKSINTTTTTTTTPIVTSTNTGGTASINSSSKSFKSTSSTIPNTTKTLPPPASGLHKLTSTKDKTTSSTTNTTTATSSSSLNPIGYLVIEIKDNGIGIAPENQSKLFGQFVQFDRNKLQQGNGSGLGLWICHKIVEYHGGTLRCTSDGIGRGTTFYVELPLVEAPEGFSINHDDYMCDTPDSVSQMSPVRIRPRHHHHIPTSSSSLIYNSFKEENEDIEEDTSSSPIQSQSYPQQKKKQDEEEEEEEEEDDESVENTEIDDMRRKTTPIKGDSRDMSPPVITTTSNSNSNSSSEMKNERDIVKSLKSIRTSSSPPSPQPPTGLPSSSSPLSTQTTHIDSYHAYIDSLDSQSTTTKQIHPSTTTTTTATRKESFKKPPGGSTQMRNESNITPLDIQLIPTEKKKQQLSTQMSPDKHTPSTVERVSFRTSFSEQLDEPRISDLTVSNKLSSPFPPSYEDKSSSMNIYTTINPTTTSNVMHLVESTDSRDKASSVASVTTAKSILKAKSSSTDSYDSLTRKTVKYSLFTTTTVESESESEVDNSIVTTDHLNSKHQYQHRRPRPKPLPHAHSWQPGTSHTSLLASSSNDGLSSSPRYHQSILIVDDSALNRKMLHLILASEEYILPSCHIQEADDGPTAIELVKQSIVNHTPYSFILLDSYMPQLNGSETAIILRQQVKYEGYIIGITGNALPEDIHAFKLSGVDDVLTKPVSRIKLLQTIKLLSKKEELQLQQQQQQQGDHLYEPISRYTL